MWLVAVYTDSCIWSVGPIPVCRTSHQTFAQEATPHQTLNRKLVPIKLSTANYSPSNLEHEACSH